MALTARSRPPRRVGFIIGAVLTGLAIAACGGDDDEVGAPAAPPPKGNFAVLQTTCPERFVVSDVTADRSPIDYIVIDDGEGGSGWDANGDLAVLCDSESDGDPFPFVASQIEFDIAPDGVVTGTATWSDSVGLSMNALISGTIVDLLDDFVLTFTASNGDTLSEIILAADPV